MTRFSLVATGGTFDIIHRGHLALLGTAFAMSEKVIIGLTSDEFAARMGKTTSNTYGQRLDSLRTAISKEFPDSSYRIARLDNDFGPAVLESAVQALVVSEETSRQGSVLNDMRAKRGIAPARIITVPMRLARDGTRISTTRIKNSEIDTEGDFV